MSQTLSQLLATNGFGTSSQVLSTDGAGNYTWVTAATGNVSTSANNAFTGANTFVNTTGQIFRQASTQDGVLLRGRAGGTSSFNVEIVPTTLTASRTLTAPNTTGTIITSGDSGTVSSTMLASSLSLSGTPTATTATAGTNTTQLATTEFVQTATGSGSGLCKAWVNFNGTGTVAIRASYNVASITDNGGTGDYTVVFSTALADANYVIAGFANGISTATGGIISARSTFAPLASSCPILAIRSDTGGAVDVSYATVAFFR